MFHGCFFIRRKTPGIRRPDFQTDTRIKNRRRMPIFYIDAFQGRRIVIAYGISGGQRQPENP
jgi:hypothetical protein